MWPYLLAAATACWLWRRGGELSGQWFWDDEESTWVWLWEGRLWIWSDQLPWVRYSEDLEDWPMQDRQRGARLWWSFNLGRPQYRAGGRLCTHPSASDPMCWQHWSGVDPWTEAARYRRQDAARASMWRLTARRAAAQRPRPAEALVLEYLGAPPIAL